MVNHLLILFDPKTMWPHAEYLQEKVCHVNLKKLHQIEYTKVPKIQFSKEKEITLSSSEASHFGVAFADDSFSTMMSSLLKKFASI